MAKLSIPISDALAGTVGRAAQILDASVTALVREAIERELDRLRLDPDFQARRRKWLGQDDGLAVVTPMPVAVEVAVAVPAEAAPQAPPPAPTAAAAGLTTESDADLDFASLLDDGANPEIP